MKMKLQGLGNINLMITSKKNRHLMQKWRNYTCLVRLLSYGFIHLIHI
ncbi:hypothetical protein SAMN06265379_101120 [Saccharicrinis carchari]|uniref:Uncharacterized protein n=1 Tax=Saccharicrinis carchari TaxID=1168039 RepID=A0A521AG10_SACCC|nr:hypothetical protein SAMN06265379_101120 [Saccharicrinis carchari]